MVTKTFLEGGFEHDFKHGFKNGFENGLNMVLITV